MKPWHVAAHAVLSVLASAVAALAGVAWELDAPVHLRGHATALVAGGTVFMLARRDAGRRFWPKGDQ